MHDGALLLSDDDLLAALAASFPVAPVEPDMDSLRRLSPAVATLRPITSDSVRSPATARPSHWSWPRRLSPALLAGAVFGVVGAGAGISYATGTPVPAALRSIARTVGLAAPAKPATPPAVAPTAAANPGVQAARQAESTLHQALAQPHPAEAVIRHDSAVLAHRLAEFGHDPAQGAVGTAVDGNHLLYEACRQLQGATTSGGTSTGRVTSPGATIDSGGTSCPTAGDGHETHDSPSGSSATAPSTPSATRTPVTAVGRSNASTRTSPGTTTRQSPSVRTPGTDHGGPDVRSPDHSGDPSSPGHAQNRGVPTGSGFGDPSRTGLSEKGR